MNIFHRECKYLHGAAIKIRINEREISSLLEYFVTSMSIFEVPIKIVNKRANKQKEHLPPRYIRMSATNASPKPRSMRMNTSAIAASGHAAHDAERASKGGEHCDEDFENLFPVGLSF